MQKRYREKMDRIVTVATSYSAVIEAMKNSCYTFIWHLS